MTARASEPLRIAIDGSAIPQQPAGAGVYTCQLVRALAGLPGEQELIVFARAGLFDDLPGRQRRLRVVHVGPRSRTARLAWEQAVLPVLLRRLRVDVLHSPHHHTPIAAGLLAAASGRRLRRVVTFHDVTFMLLPDRYPLARRLYMEAVTRASARVADAVITPSQAVRRDVVRKLGIASERVVAIPEAAGSQFQPADDDSLGRLRWKYRLPSRYILSVGSLEPGKNRGRLMRAFARLQGEAVDCALVIAGQPAWRYEDDLLLARRLGAEGRVRFLGYVPDADLPALYSGATLFAFPSLYEGFGLPVLEAMACGTPVVTSAGSALEEVAGDASVLVDPRDEAGLAEALRLVLSDEALRADLRARGVERAKQFSWEHSARETLSVYETVRSLPT